MSQVLIYIKMESCQKRTLGIRAKESEPMSRVTEEPLGSHSRWGCGIAEAALPQDQTTATWDFPHQERVLLLASSSKKTELITSKLPEFIKIILPAHHTLTASSQGMKMTDSFSSLFTWEKKVCLYHSHPNSFEGWETIKSTSTIAWSAYILLMSGVHSD